MLIMLVQEERTLSDQCFYLHIHFRKIVSHKQNYYNYYYNFPSVINTVSDLQTWAPDQRIFYLNKVHKCSLTIINKNNYFSYGAIHVPWIKFFSSKKIQNGYKSFRISVNKYLFWNKIMKMILNAYDSTSKHC